MAKLKTATQIKREKAYYFVIAKGDCVCESESLTECKEFLAQYIKEHKEEVKAEPHEYYIGMYSIGVEDYGE